jgi:hypothetical protein
MKRLAVRRRRVPASGGRRLRRKDPLINLPDRYPQPKPAGLPPGGFKSLHKIYPQYFENIFDAEGGFGVLKAIGNM